MCVPQQVYVVVVVVAVSESFFSLFFSRLIYLTDSANQLGSKPFFEISIHE